MDPVLCLQDSCSCPEVRNAEDAPVPELVHALEWRVELPVSWRVHSVRETSGNQVEMDLDRVVNPGWIAEAYIRLEAPLERRLGRPVSSRWEFAYRKAAAGPASIRVAVRLHRETESQPALVAALVSAQKWPLLDKGIEQPTGANGSGLAHRELPESIDEYCWPQVPGGSQTAVDQFRPLLDEVARQAAQVAERWLERELLSRWEQLPVGEIALAGSVECETEDPSVYQELLGKGQLALLQEETGLALMLSGAGLNRLPELFVDVWLPLVEKRRWKNRLEVFPACTVEGGILSGVHLQAPGCADSWEHELGRGLLLALEGAPANNARLHFADTRRMPAILARYLLSWLVSDTGILQQAREWLSVAGQQDDVEIEVQVCWPVQEMSCWREVPRERSTGHYALFSRISDAVQWTLRCWVPYMYFSDPTRFAEQAAAYAALVYHFGRPSARKTRSELTYDPMSLASAKLAAHHALRTVSSWMPVVRDLVRVTCPESEALYTRRQLDRLASGVPASKPFRALLALDALVIRELVNLGNECRKRASLAEPADREEFPLAVAARLSRAMAKAFRHTYAGQQWSSLGMLVLGVATAALRQGLGLDTELQGWLYLRHSGLSRVWPLAEVRRGWERL